MLYKILRWLGFAKSPDTLDIDSDGQPVGEEVIEAVVRVLIEITRSDNDIAKSEAGAILEIIRSNFLIAESAIPNIVRRAAEVAKSNPSLDETFARLNATYNSDQKILLLAACWRIVLADGQIEAAERRFTVQLRYRFQLNEQQEAIAKSIAEHI